MSRALGDIRVVIAKNRSVIITDSNMKFGRWAILMPGNIWRWLENLSCQRKIVCSFKARRSLKFLPD